MKYVTLALAIIAASLCSIAPAQELSQRDQIHVAVQAICPVSGQKLGEHGAPIKVKVGEETVFFCCQACLQGKVNPQHWATIHSNFAEAQRVCPVMKKELPKNPKWTIVEGQIAYVCCPSCAKKIAADPKTFLHQIDDLYLASLRARQARR
jgi:YHS domain-containing protein